MINAAPESQLREVSDVSIHYPVDKAHRQQSLYPTTVIVMVTTQWNTRTILQWRTDNPYTQLDLSDADLHDTNLVGVDLSRANLRRVNLSGANLYGANLYGAHLSRADLHGANLRDANLSRAYLYRVNLSRADLTGAALSGAKLGRLRIFQMGPTGSRRAYWTYKAGPEMDEAMAGCFIGTLGEMEAAVLRRHREFGTLNPFGLEYQADIDYIRARLALAPALIPKSWVGMPLSPSLVGSSPRYSN